MLYEFRYEVRHWLNPEPDHGDKFSHL
jgi:hypothetical protein